MEFQTANSSNSPVVNELPRCQKRTRKGRCTMLVADPASPFCPEHSRAATRFRKAADLSSLLTEGLTDFKSATPINDFLSRLLLLQAQGVVEPRRAAVMAYNCNLLLRTLPAIEHERNPADQEREIIWDLPRPKGD